MRIKVLVNIRNQRIKSLKLDLIGIDNTAHAKDIVDVHASLFPDTVMSIHEYDYESGVPRKNELRIMTH